MESSRMTYLGGGAIVAVVAVALLTVLLDPDGIAAALLLDRMSTIFPYPFTIQNVMTVSLGVAVGDLLWIDQRVRRQRTALSLNLLPEDPATLLCLADLPYVRKSLDRLRPSQRGVLSEMIESCSLHFAQTRSTAEVLSMMEAQTRMAEQASERTYAFSRYAAWFLPTVGFIGTVVGIAGALVIAADASAAGDVGGALPDIVAALAVAFNTTILSLVFSAIVVFLQSWVQSRDEGFLSAAADYCMANLVRRLFVAPDER
jgi:flagellar motor component MotA